MLYTISGEDAARVAGEDAQKWGRRCADPWCAGSGHLSEDCRTLLDNAASVIDVNYCEDPRYKLVVDDLE